MDEKKKRLILQEIESEKLSKEFGWKLRCRSLVNQISRLEDPFERHIYVGSEMCGRSNRNTRIYDSYSGFDDDSDAGEAVHDVIHISDYPPSDQELKLKAEKREREEARRKYCEKKEKQRSDELKKNIPKYERNIPNPPLFPFMPERLGDKFFAQTPNGPLQLPSPYMKRTYKPLTLLESHGITEEEWLKRFPQKL